MKVYFVSAVTAALKLDGEYAGIIDGFERFCNVDCGRGVLAEIIPGGNLQPLNFFIDGGFFKNPPDCAEVYVCSGSRIIYLRGFAGKDASLKLIMQRPFCGITVTIYRQGGCFLSCEGETFETYPLPCDYLNPRAEEVQSGGRKLLALYGGKWLTIVNQKGKIVFMNEIDGCTFGDTLEITAPLFSCSGCVAECAFSYGGSGFKAVNSRTAERRPQGGELLPFVFFERVLYCGDYAALLCDELKPKAGSLKKYLGDFTAVTVPPADFYAEHPEENAAGLVFKKKSNLSEIIFYAVDVSDGKITNIRPV